jgi:hypothetical protein
MNQHSICRDLLAQQMVEVRKLFTPEQIAKAWAWSGDRKSWEFHGPEGEYLYNLRMADCAWSAKAEGWSQLLERKEQECR